MGTIVEEWTASFKAILGFWLGTPVVLELFTSPVVSDGFGISEVATELLVIAGLIRLFLDARGEFRIGDAKATLLCKVCHSNTDLLATVLASGERSGEQDNRQADETA
jgi:hypothetical protein